MKKTALLCAGQGAQFVGMGKDLVEHDPEAAGLFQIANSILGDSFQKICFEGPEEELTKTSMCQPALFVQGIALHQLLKKKFPDFSPVACAGLSLGEFTAHTAAGHLSFESGLGLVHERGRLMQEACDATEGGMLTLIGASPEQAEKLAASSGLEIANINCPGQIVLSGASDRVPAAVEAGKELGLRRVVPLKVAGAYHSALMASAQEGLAPHLESTEFTENQIPVYSNITGRPANGTTEIKETLLKQVTGSVLWQQCIENMVADGIEQFIELGPGRILAGMCKRTAPDTPCHSIGSMADLEALESLS